MSTSLSPCDSASSCPPGLRLPRQIAYDPLSAAAFVRFLVCTDFHASLSWIFQVLVPARDFVEPLLLDYQCSQDAPFRRSSRNSEAGSTLVTNRWSRARVQAT